jgi:hypothetical protein
MFCCDILDQFAALFLLTVMYAAFHGSTVSDAGKSMASKKEPKSVGKVCPLQS